MAENEEKATSPQDSQPQSIKKAATKKAKKKRAKKTAKPTASKADTSKPRGSRNFPASTFQDALVVAEAFQKYAAGQTRVRKLTLFDKMGKSPDSGPSRQLITNSSRYGLTKGGYQADFLELTAEGALATGDDVPPPKKLQARFDLAIKNIEPFNFLYERCKGQKLPSKEFLIDALRESEPSETSLSECVDTFILNATFLGLLRTIAGSERLITIEHGLEETGKIAGSSAAVPTRLETQDASLQAISQLDGYESICFYITPIGGDDSEQRKHSDFFMEFVITPALKEFDLRLVRADQIGKPGMIGKQVLEHILNARLVIADLSFHNPNVFYELCLRHATRQPTVQVIRASEAIPFDIDQYRTVKIDTGDIYGLLPKLQTYISEIANQVRMALKDPDSVDSPVSMYYPLLKLTWKA
ncbi:hypothetical protein [Paracidobacterium acidisoli]|uniref:Uncharacterized protein n=1 Tax=Paracidobacterium acidisoli TaxID=2303751 RepID=A0A372ISL4_9BACT|nr:hypothetical protein [Paracidobacterium acidisoli]MBT9330806.1 hypothetical protein [Paracidobacterium acidisoli]